MDCEKNLEKELLAPYMHLLQVKSKQFRNKIVLAFNYWFKVPDDLVQNALNAMTMTYNASLLIDDIQDNSIKRRGIEAAHCIYGIPLTINTAVHVLVLALKQELDLVPAALGGKIFVDHVLDVIYGQGVEIYWRDNFMCPSEKEYKEMVQQKTGAMLLYGVKLIQVLSDDKRNYDDFVKLLGFYFQLRDDYCNLKQLEALEEYPEKEDESVNKEQVFCEDITEGKFSLPIIHAMKTPQGPTILSILFDHLNKE
nr:geranylgeranyl pyrophosphate synthase-like [Danaus plexippus plexippus]